MKHEATVFGIVFLALVLCFSSVCRAESFESAGQNTAYAYEAYPLERNGVSLHLDCMKLEGAQPEKNILLIHGVTYSSHEFDVNFEDYSLVRFLAREGYAVWRLDIAGFGQSGAVEDGFLPDSDYAAEDINAAVETIVGLTGQNKIDVLGWSWGTVTVSRFAAKYPEHIRKLVLYAPILTGLGAYEVTEPFHHNTWEHAASDFQLDAAGNFDYEIADPVVIEMLCSSSWHYDGESSPNGGRKDLCVPASETLIDLEKISVPLLLIYGDSDPYLNDDAINAAAASLPEGSEVTVIPGGSHVVYIEKPYYRAFQDALASFLRRTQGEQKAANLPDALDYGDPRNWVYLASEDGETAVDVFFIAPSAFGGGEGAYIMDLTNEKTMGNFVGVINMEKGIYERNTRFYAPVYRQAGYRVCSLPDAEAEPLMQSAFADVKDAFAYYLEHWNEGRPFILAGFSQGAEMSLRLMKEYFGDEALQKQLIACYAIGWRLTEEETEAWPQLRAAQGETDTGVIISFNSEAEDVSDSIMIPAGTKTLSINPLNWKTDGEMAGKEMNLGACFTDYGGNILDEVPELTGAYLDAERGALKVTDIDPAEYSATLSILAPGVYHVYDYQFFYRNLEKNVQDRMQAYLNK